MPSISNRSTRAIANTEPATDNEATMMRTADGHRAPPRYPDGIDFDLCDDTKRHVSKIRDHREDFA